MSESHISQTEVGGPRTMALVCAQPVFLKVLRIYSVGQSGPGRLFASTMEVHAWRSLTHTVTQMILNRCCRQW